MTRRYEDFREDVRRVRDRHKARVPLAMRDAIPRCSAKLPPNVRASPTATATATSLPSLDQAIASSPMPPSTMPAQPHIKNIWITTRTTIQRRTRAQRALFHAPEHQQATLSTGWMPLRSYLERSNRISIKSRSPGRAPRYSQSIWPRIWTRH